MTYARAQGHRTARNHGHTGGYRLICFVGGATYAISLLVLKRRG